MEVTIEMKNAKYKINIRILLLLLLICMLATPAAAKTNYKKIYGKILKKSEITYKDEDGYQSSFSPAAFVLINLDQKGVKELIITDEYKSQWHVYTIKKGKAKRIFTRRWMGSDGDGLFYNKKKKGLARTWSEGTGMVDFCLFRFKNGKKASDIHLYSSYISGSSPSRFYRMLDGKQISEEKFQRYYKKYFQKVKSGSVWIYPGTKYYKFVTNTAANRNKKLK